LIVSGNYCVNKTLKEFVDAVTNKHGDNKHGKAYMRFVAQVKLLIKGVRE